MDDHGWVSFHRKIIDWHFYTDNNVFKVYCHLILTANHKDHRWNDQLVLRGQVVIGRKKLAKSVGLSPDQVRLALRKLKRSGEITTESTNRYTVVTIVNYDFYQSDRARVPSKIPSKIPSKTPADTQQIPTNNNNNNIISCYCSRIESPIDQKVVEELIKWQTLFKDEVILYAFEVAIIANKKSFGYINGILRNWKVEKLFTIEEIQKDLDERKSKKVHKQYKAAAQKTKPNKFHNHEQRSYDYSAIESIMTQQLDKELEDAEKLEEMRDQGYE